MNGSTIKKAKEDTLNRSLNGIHEHMTSYTFSYLCLKALGLKYEPISLVDSTSKELSI